MIVVDEKGGYPMQVILEPDEAWSIMSLVVSQVLDQVELSDGASDHPALAHRPQ
jgi:hypothetical protein